MAEFFAAAAGAVVDVAAVDAVDVAGVAGEAAMFDFSTSDGAGALDAFAAPGAAVEAVATDAMLVAGEGALAVAAEVGAGEGAAADALAGIIAAVVADVVAADFAGGRAGAFFASSIIRARSASFMFVCAGSSSAARLDASATEQSRSAWIRRFMARRNVALRVGESRVQTRKRPGGEARPKFRSTNAGPYRPFILPP